MERIDLSSLGFDGLKKHRAERLVSSVIPVEGHLTEGVVKTHGGALVAAFELAGTAYEAKTLEQRDLYKEQLNVALRNIATPRLALWSCQIRRREHVDLSASYPNAFAQQVADGYAALQQRRNLYRNRLLLFLVYRTTALRSETSLSKKVDKRLVRDLLIAGIDALEDIAVKLGASLRDYGPRRLGIYQHQGVGMEERPGNRFSEIGEAYSLLLNHTGARVPLGPFNMAEAIATNRLLYGHEAFEIRQPAKSVYGAALSIKEYPERTYPEMFRSIMDLPFDCNWVQSFAFVEKETARKLFVQQRNRLRSSGDEAVSQVTDLDQALDDLISNRFVVGEHNATLVVYGESVPKLSDNLSKAQAALSDPGCTVVREDMAVEGQVFSTLPGNTQYRARTAPGHHLDQPGRHEPLLRLPGWEKGWPPLGRGPDPAALHRRQPPLVLAPRGRRGPYLRARHDRLGQNRPPGLLSGAHAAVRRPPRHPGQGPGAQDRHPGPGRAVHEPEDRRADRLQSLRAGP